MVFPSGGANTPNPADSANPFSCPLTQKDIAVKGTRVVSVLSLEEQGCRVHLDVGNHHLFEHTEVYVGVRTTLLSLSRHFLLLFFSPSAKFTAVSAARLKAAEQLERLMTSLHKLLK